MGADSNRLRKTTLSVLLAATLVLSALLASSNDDSMAGWLREDAATPSSPMGRFLLEDGLRDGLDLDLDGEAAVGAWGRRSLRARERKLKDASGDRERRREESENGSWQRMQKESWRRVLDMVNAEEPEQEMGFDSEWQPKRRMAVRVPRYADKHHFDECVGKTVDDCQVLIDTYVSEHTENFNNRTSLRMELRKIREYTDESYYKVVLRTDTTATRIAGVFDDGGISYPWPWTVDGEPRLIGPWNCTGQTPEDCCRDIQLDVAVPNDYGDLLACFVEEPVGTIMNPERDNRAITVVDSNLVVMRAPIAH